jgi:15-cis-phytoene synthase
MNPQTSSKNSSARHTVQAINQKSRSNFFSAFLFLSKDSRRGIEAVYAFCRLVDDVVDESASPQEAHQKLIAWREELEQTYTGSPGPPVMREIAWTVSRFSIPKKYFEDLLDGVEKDLHHHRYEDFDQLCDYAYGVASVVGLMCMKIFEVNGADAERAAILLGRALQLTNILRDIKSDAVRGRIYLPLKDLRLFSITEDEVLKGKTSSKMDSLLYYEIGQVEAIYAESFRLMKSFSRKPLLAAWIMGKVYFRLLQEIKKNPRRPFQEKVNLSKWTKIRIVLREWIRSRY